MKAFRFHPKITLDHASLIPLRAQIVEQMRVGIVRNRFDPGTRIISERRLADELGINRNTVHQAYEELAAANLIAFSEFRRGGARVADAAKQQYRIPFPSINLILPYTFGEQLARSNRQGLEIIGGILDRAAEKHLSVNIMALPPPDLERKQITEWLESFIPRSIGVITLGLRSGAFDPVFEALIECRTIPHVFVSARSPHEYISSVSADLATGTGEMLDACEVAGRREIGIVSGFPTAVGKQFCNAALYRGREIAAAARRREFAVREYQLTYRVTAGQEYHFDARELVRSFLDDPRTPHALWFQNDAIACAVIDEMRARHIRIPQDFAVAGYDDSAPESYDLSSITHSRPALGKCAVDSIAELFEHGKPGDALHRSIPSRFIARGSTRQGPLT